MNKVSNLIKFYNRKPINIINDLTIGYSNYNAKQNNCQVFIRNLLEASGMYGNEIFIMQDIKQIFHGFTGTGLIPSKSK